MKVVGIKESRHFHMIVEDPTGERHDVPIDETTYNHMRQLHAHRAVSGSNGGNEQSVAAIAGGGDWMNMLMERESGGGSVEAAEFVDQRSKEDLLSKVGYLSEEDDEEDPGEFHSALADDEEGAPQI